MTLTILDPQTGNRVTIEVATKPNLRRVQRRILREPDGFDANKKPGTSRAS